MTTQTTQIPYLTSKDYIDYLNWLSDAMRKEPKQVKAKKLGKKATRKKK